MLSNRSFCGIHEEDLDLYFKFSPAWFIHFIWRFCYNCIENKMSENYNKDYQSNKSLYTSSRSKAVALFTIYHIGQKVIRILHILTHRMPILLIWYHNAGLSLQEPGGARDFPWLLWAWAPAPVIGNKRKIQPKELPSCTISLLLIA